MKNSAFCSDPKFWLKIRNQVKRFLRKTERPTRLGEISLEIKLNLRQTREIVEKMIDEGVVRALTLEECNRLLNMHADHTYLLVDPKSIPMGDLE